VWRWVSRLPWPVRHDSGVRIGVGLSTARDGRRAAAEAALGAADGLAGEPPSLAVLFASPHHSDDAAAVLAEVRRSTGSAALFGCVAQAVVGGIREVEDEPAVVVWLAALPRTPETFHMEFLRTRSGGVFAGYRFDRSGQDLHLLLPDPYTFPAELLLDHLNAHVPGSIVMGGLVSGARDPGGSRLFRDGEVVASGAVGVRVPGWRGVSVVSQGCRQIGEPYTVTAAEGRVITGLGGRPPLERLLESVAALPPDQRMLVSQGLHIGAVVNEYVERPGRGDFLIRAVTGWDESTGAIEVGDLVDVGMTMQFHVRDATGADDDLRAALDRARAAAPRPPVGALLFTCNGRGRRMFGVPNHDAMLVGKLLDGIPLAGFFAAGELGPIGGRNALHGFTASLAVFVDEPV
jgi:small ligand-binding sensory domain FIST